MTNKAICWYDRLVVFSCCALIYFLPISSALVEIFSSLAIFFYLVKKIAGFYSSCRDYALLSVIGKIKTIAQIPCPVSSPIHRPLGLLVLVTFFSVLLSQNRAASVEAFCFKFLQQVLLFCAVFEGFRSRKDILIFLVILCISAGLLGLDGIVQYLTGRDFIHGYEMCEPGRAQGAFKQANDFGTYLIFVFPVPLTLLFLGPGVFDFWNVKKGKARSFFLLFMVFFYRLFLVFALIGVFVSLGLSYSRGAWIGFIVAMGFGMIILKKKYILLILGFLVVFCFVFFPQLKAHRKYVEFKTPTSHLGQEQQAVLLSNKIMVVWDFFDSALGGGQGRVGFWHEAVRVIKHYPVFGSGLNTYTEMAPRYKISWGGYAHNCYLQMAAEIGILGLAVFFWLVFSFYRYGLKVLRRNKDDWGGAVISGFLAGMLAFLVHAFFDTNFYSVRLANLPWIAMGIVLAVCRIIQQESPEFVDGKGGSTLLTKKKPQV